jgi:hypothetical protein
MLKKIFGKREEMRETSENHIMRTYTICTLHKILDQLGFSNKDKELDSACSKNERHKCIFVTEL